MTTLRLLRVRVPLLVAHVAAHGAEVERDVVLVEWTGSDGVAGWGECPSLSRSGYATETTEVAWRALVDQLGPASLGSVEHRRAPPVGVVAAPSALADAQLDARLRAEGVALGAHLGAAWATLARCEVLADLGAAPHEIASRAQRAVEGGATMVKVKIAPGHDHAVLAAVVDSVGAGAVAADCNGSYVDPRELSGVDRLGLRYLEQPFAPSRSWAELAELHHRLATPVALDESLRSVAAVRQALDAGALEVVSVKPARLGGAEAAAAAVALAVEAGMDAFVGGMLELGIGRATAVAVAGSPGCTLPTDLGPSTRYVATDICAPITLDERGWLVPPRGPGVGRTPDPEALASFTVDEVVLRSGG